MLTNIKNLKFIVISSVMRLQRDKGKVLLWGLREEKHYTLFHTSELLLAY